MAFGLIQRMAYPSHFIFAYEMSRIRNLWNINLWRSPVMKQPPIASALTPRYALKGALLFGCIEGSCSLSSSVSGSALPLPSLGTVFASTRTASIRIIRASATLGLSRSCLFMLLSLLHNNWTSFRFVRNCKAALDGFVCSAPRDERQRPRLIYLKYFLEFFNIFKYFKAHSWTSAGAYSTPPPTKHQSGREVAQRPASSKECAAPAHQPADAVRLCKEVALLLSLPLPQSIAFVRRCCRRRRRRLAHEPCGRAPPSGHAPRLQLLCDTRAAAAGGVDVAPAPVVLCVAAAPAVVCVSRGVGVGGGGGGVRTCSRVARTRTRVTAAFAATLPFASATRSLAHLYEHCK